MSVFFSFNPVEALGKLLREQTPCIEPLYSTVLQRHRNIVSVELRLLDFMSKGDGTNLEEAKQNAALAMLEMLEATHSLCQYEYVKTSSGSSPMLKSTKKFWMELRLQKEVESLLKQLIELKGHDFSCLDDHLNRLRQLCVDQDTENQHSQFKDKLEKLPSNEMTSNEMQSPLTKEALETHDKKVGKMTVIDRLGINATSSLANIDKKNYDIEAVTETTNDGSEHTFDQSENDEALSNQIKSQSKQQFQIKEDKNNEIEDTRSKNEANKGDGDSVSKKEHRTKEAPLRWLMLIVQSGCDYEAEEKNVLECLSKFGSVELLKWGKWVGNFSSGGGGGRVKFSHPSTARSVVNKLFTVDGVTFHTSWRHEDLHLLKGPVPFQVLLESDHLPRTWEKHMVVKKAMVQYGEVLAVDFYSGRKAVVSFSDEWVVQNLIDCWWKVNGTPVLAKEVSCFTLK